MNYELRITNYELRITNLTYVFLIVPYVVQNKKLNIKN